MFKTNFFLTNFFVFLFIISNTSFAKSANSEWFIVMEKSKINFSVNHGGNKVEGKFKKFDSEIKFDPENLDESYALINIDLSSATTGNLTYDKTLPKEDWFNINSQAIATYKTSKIIKKIDNIYEIHATLMIRGVSVSKTIEASIDINNNNAKLTAKFNINRLDFNIGRSSDPDGHWVSLDIPIFVEINAIKN